MSYAPAPGLLRIQFAASLFGSTQSFCPAKKLPEVFWVIGVDDTGAVEEVVVVAVEEVVDVDGDEVVEEVDGDDIEELEDVDVVEVDVVEVEDGGVAVVDAVEVEDGGVVDGVTDVGVVVDVDVGDVDVDVVDVGDVDVETDVDVVDVVDVVEVVDVVDCGDVAAVPDVPEPATATIICAELRAISLPLKSLATNVILYGPLPFHVHPLKSMFAIFTGVPPGMLALAAVGETAPSLIKFNWPVSTCQYI